MLKGFANSAVGGCQFFRRNSTERVLKVEKFERIKKPKGGLGFFRFDSPFFPAPNLQGTPHALI